MSKRFGKVRKAIHHDLMQRTRGSDHAHETEDQVVFDNEFRIIHAPLFFSSVLSPESLFGGGNVVPRNLEHVYYSAIVVGLWPWDVRERVHLAGPARLRCRSIDHPELESRSTGSQPRQYVQVCP